jgi:cell division protein FtsA
MFITALDLGTSQIKILVAEAKRDGQLSLLGVFKLPSAGLRKAEIVTFEEAIQSLKRAVDEIKQISKSSLKNIFINVGSSNVKLQTSRGIVAVSRADSEIYSEDIERVIKASQAINLGPNRMILHTITREFIVDGISDIINPLGMIGNRLEVNSLIIDAFKPAVNNLIKAVEAVGAKVGGLIYSPLASARAVLTKAQRELGVALIDIGFGTTGVAVYEEDKLLSANVFPVGSSNITNDLAICLRCSIKTAEAIKLSFGSALAKEISNKEKIELHQIDETLKSIVNRRFISEIIEIRLAEIFEFVNNELKLIGKTGQLPAGVVLAGGGAKIPGILELAKQELKLSIQIGIPELPGMEFINDDFRTKIEDQEFSVANGLLLWGLDQALKETGWTISKKSWLSKIFRHFLP